jgi:hypothetical protein
MSKEDYIHTYRAANLIVASQIAIAAAGDQAKEKKLIDGFNRVLDGMYDRFRENCRERHAA